MESSNIHCKASENGDEVKLQPPCPPIPHRYTRKINRNSSRTSNSQQQNARRMVLEPKFADYGSILHSAAAAAAAASAGGTTTTDTNNHIHHQHVPLTPSTLSQQQQPPHHHQHIYNLQYPQQYQNQQQPQQHVVLLNGAGQPAVDAAPAASNNMTQEDDMYQRKPLLPVAGKGGADSPWGSPTSMPSYYGDEDDENVLQSKSSESSNGIIKITMPAPVREEPRFPQERWKTLLAAIILFFNFVMVLTSLALVHERVPDRSTYGPLPDVFHDAVPAQDWALDVSEYLLIICFNSAIVAVLLHKHRFIVARRCFLIMSLLYMYRSITMYVTAMPISSTTYYCSPKSNQTSPVEVVKRIVQLAAGMGLSINGKHTYCGDYIYSGHTVILVFSYLIISEYTPKKLYVIHWAYGLAALTGVTMLMVAHGHYTVDVIIAYYITTRLFWMYHTLANYHVLKQHSPNNLLGRAWWFRVFVYFEGNVGGAVPRQWPDWPFPRPRRLHTKSRES